MSAKPKSKTKTKTKAKAKKKSAVKPKAKAKQTARPKAVKKAPPSRKAAQKAAPERAAPAAKPRRSDAPEGYSSVTAYLVAQDASAAIDYYKAVFGAKEEMRMGAPGGRVGHAELRIGDTKIMIADEYPDMGARGPRHYNGSPVSLTLYVKDVDATVKLAIKKGAKLLREVQDQFYGDRSGTIEDPAGHIWHVMTHVEDVSPKEMDRRMKAMMKEEKVKAAEKAAKGPPTTVLSSTPGEL
jgi:PhnB protein